MKKTLNSLNIRGPVFCLGDVRLERAELSAEGLLCSAELVAEVLERDLKAHSGFSVP